jgi:hypothetical protein
VLTGRAERPPNKIRVCRTYDGSTTDAFGEPPFFQATERATWSRRDPLPRFTPHASPAFKAEVEVWLLKYPQ